MPDLVWLGTVPAWLSPFATVLVASRTARLADFGDKVLQAAGLAAEEVTKSLETDEDGILAEAVARAAEAASRATLRDHRALLAQVVADGVTGAITPDVAQLRVGTLASLEGVHLTVLLNIIALAEIARATSTKPGRHHEAITIDLLAEMSPGADVVALEVVVRQLAREDLVTLEPSMTLGARPSAYGTQLVQSLRS